jgi:hypothetical protein
MGGCTSGADADKTASIERLDEHVGWQVLPYRMFQAARAFALIPLPVV